MFLYRLNKIGKNPHLVSERETLDSDCRQMNDIVNALSAAETDSMESPSPSRAPTPNVSEGLQNLGKLLVFPGINLELLEARPSQRPVVEETREQEAVFHHTSEVNTTRRKMTEKKEDTTLKSNGAVNEGTCSPPNSHSLDKRLSRQLSPSPLSRRRQGSVCFHARQHLAESAALLPGKAN